MVPQGIARSNDCYLNGALKDKPTASECIDFNQYWALDRATGKMVSDLASFVSYDRDGVPDGSGPETDYYTMKQCGLGTQVCLALGLSRQRLLTHAWCGRRMRAVQNRSTSPRAPRGVANRPATTPPAATLHMASALTRASSVPTAVKGADACLSKCRGRRAAATWAPIGWTQSGTSTTTPCLAFTISWSTGESSFARALVARLTVPFFAAGTLPATSGRRQRSTRGTCRASRD